MPRKSKLNKFMDKYNELAYMQDIPHTISTGNKKVDKLIAKVTRKVSDVAIKNPKLKIGMKIAEKSYPYVEDSAAWVARVKTAYKESKK